MSKNYTTIFDLFDEVWSDAFSSLAQTQTQPSRFNKMIASGDWPPANVIIDNKTKELTFEIALAGVKEENINLSWDGDYLQLVVNKKTGDESLKEGETRTSFVVQRGFRPVDFAEVKWIVDPRYYSRDDVKVVFENGLLTIKVFPRQEVAPKQIKLFGTLADKKEITE